MQAAELLTLIREMHQHGLHVAIDTSGFALTQPVTECLEEADLVMLSVKGFSDEEYRQNTERPLFSQTIAFLDELERLQKTVRLRYLLVPGITDSTHHLEQLAALERKYDCVQEVELLRFRKLCIEKYRELDLQFPLTDTPEADAALLDRCKQYYNSIR